VISKPTTPQLIDAVRTELASKVSPELGDGPTRVLLDMALAVLQGASVRSANEVAWMHEEAEAIEALATRLLGELPGATGLADALKAYSDGKTGSLYLADVQADYERASEVLSCAAEAVYEDGDAARKAAVQELFDARMANENAVIGAFEAVGRT
jgi:hypothetical protein